MIPRFAVTATWAAAACLAATSVWRMHESRRLWSEQVRMNAPALIDIPDGPSSGSLDEAIVRATTANVFRWDRAPADPAAQPTVGLEPQGAPPMNLPMPSVSLRGILGGPPWTAVLQGVPGAPSAVVLRAGDTISGFSIVRIRRDTVVVRNGANTYTLTLSSR